MDGLGVGFVSSRRWMRQLCWSVGPVTEGDVGHGEGWGWLQTDGPGVGLDSSRRWLWHFVGMLDLG